MDNSPQPRQSTENEEPPLIDDVTDIAPDSTPAPEPQAQPQPPPVYQSSTPSPTPTALIVGQSGGATAAINSSLVGVIREARAQGVRRIYGMRNGIQGLLQGDLVDLGSLPNEVLPALQQTPSAALGSCRYHLTDADIPQAIAVLREHGVQCMVYIGGNDSADTSHRLAQSTLITDDLRVIAVPKTIDNDLPITDHCPGYGSAARYIAIAALETTLDTKAMPDIYPVKILETMGRHSGWLTASAALARATGWETPHLIYVPECPKEVDEILGDVTRIYRDFGYVVIAMSENLRSRDQRPFAIAALEAMGDGAESSVSNPDFTDSFGHSYYRTMSAGHALAQLITSRLDLRARIDQPGTLQRMSQAHQSEVDLIEAEECGRAAVRAALSGETDRMVIIERAESPIYRATIGLAPLESIANVEKHLPVSFMNPAGNFVTQSFIDYALPLIGGPLPQYVELQT
jgi:ATP-dependent phosphofructokinase / diphosphate-dependent phosphofructokinase